MRYNPRSYVVELHFEGLTDVFSHDYGPDHGCAARAVERIKQVRPWPTGLIVIRVWHAGRLVQEEPMD